MDDNGDLPEIGESGGAGAETLVAARTVSSIDSVPAALPGGDAITYRIAGWVGLCQATTVSRMPAASAGDGRLISSEVGL